MFLKYKFNKTKIYRSFLIGRLINFEYKIVTLIRIFKNFVGFKFSIEETIEKLKLVFLQSQLQTIYYAISMKQRFKNLQLKLF